VLFLFLAERRVVDLQQQIVSLTLVSRHVQVVLPVVNEQRIHYLRRRFIDLRLGELLPEMGRQLRNLLIGDRRLLGLDLSQQLGIVVAKVVVTPVRILHKFLTDFLLKIGLDGHSTRMDVSTGFHKNPQSLVPLGRKPSMFVLLSCIDKPLPVNSRENVFNFLRRRISLRLAMLTPVIFLRRGTSGRTGRRS
jgi:hypothetical protein